MTEKAQLQPYPLRLRPELREQLETAAKQGGRSLQSEIVARLEASFDGGALDMPTLLRLLTQEAERAGVALTITPKIKPPAKRA